MIGTNYYFTGELGKELHYISQLISTGRFPLVGLATSHEWLTYGPAYYWIMIPVVKIFGFSPFILFWVALAVSVIGILITYFVFSKIVDAKFTAILAFFVSVSPLWIQLTRLSKLHTFFFILIPLVIYFLYKIWNKDKRYFFWLGLAFGFLFSFHYSQIPILGVLLLAFWIKRKGTKLGDYLKFAVGLILPNITILIYDAKSGFTMVKDLVMWIPYRILGFAGLYPKNNLDIVTGGSTISAFNEFLGRNLFWDGRFWVLGSIVFLILFVAFFMQNYKRFSKDFFVFYLISSTIVQFGALLVHTTPPVHYFLPVFLNFGLLFSFFVCKYWKRPSVKVFTALIIVLIAVIDILNMPNEHADDIDYIPLGIQEGVAKSIVRNAAGKPFVLTRVGPYDYYPETYDQNYQFLIMQDGGKIDQSAKLKYIIYDIGTVYIQKVD
jgi:hypothetical protein